MKRITIATVALFTVFIMNSCSEYWGFEIKRGGDAEKSLLIYLGANNNLSDSAKSNLNVILANAAVPSERKDTILMVFHHFYGSSPVLRRYYRMPDGTIIGELIAKYDESFNSGTVDGFLQVERDANNKYPARKKGLVMSSHGSGWTPEGYYSDPIDMTGPDLDRYKVLQSVNSIPTKSDTTKSIVIDRNREIEIPVLAKEMQQHYEFICLDACFMSCIELAYALKEKCDYLLASPTEILSQGYPYAVVFDNLMTGGEQALSDFCDEFAEEYSKKGSSYQNSFSIALTKTAGLDALAACTKTLFEKYSAERSAINRQDVQHYFRNRDAWFFDFSDYMYRFTPKREYATFQRYMDDVVINKAHSDFFLSLEIKSFSGLSIYIPSPAYPHLNAYYKTLGWNDATGNI